LTGVNLVLNNKVTDKELIKAGFDEIVIATGITPRLPSIEGINHPKVLTYIDLLKYKKQVGDKVAIIGAGGIGFDVADYLTNNGASTSQDVKAFLEEWGIDSDNENRGGLESKGKFDIPNREVTMLQRKGSKMGMTLGKTTGWIHRIALKHKKVKMMVGINYHKIDDDGLHFSTKSGKEQVLNVDNVIICAGQHSENSLFEPLKKSGQNVSLIGGAYAAGDLDAKRAIKQAARLAAEV